MNVGRGRIRRKAVRVESGLQSSELGAEEDAQEEERDDPEGYEDGFQSWGFAGRTFGLWFGRRCDGGGGFEVGRGVVCLARLVVDITEGDTRLSSTIESSVPLPSMNEKQLRQTREATVNSRGEMARKNTCLHCIFYSTRWTGNWPPSRTSSETSQNMKFPPPDSAAGMFSVQDWISSLFSMPLSVRPKVLSQDGHD